jgi:hypothetical protein
MEASITLRISRKLQGGICVRCCQFRYCKYQTELNQFVCENCVQTLRNQSLLTLIDSRPSSKAS